ncbi:MAG: 16S rRNA (uracil(1498)-N(3))-methyltransferase, partial [Gammaproteobacteria bacterium]
MPRLFVPLRLEVGAEVRLPATAAHRVREVLRLRVGETLTVFDGHGGEYHAEVRRCARDGVDLALGAHRAVMRESPLQITLAQGLARGERMDFTLQKSVELGVSRIVPLATERSQVKLDAERAARRTAHWRALILHACEQCGRDQVPELSAVMRIADFIAADDAEVRLTLAPTGKLSLKNLSPEARRFSLVIGPEGGLSPPEIELLATHGYRAARLGPRILRTETAALVALTALQTLHG